MQWALLEANGTRTADTQRLSPRRGKIPIVMQPAPLRNVETMLHTTGGAGQHALATFTHAKAHQLLKVQCCAGWATKCNVQTNNINWIIAL